MVNKKTMIGLAVLAAIGLLVASLKYPIDIPSEEVVILPSCQNVETLTDMLTDDFDPHWSPDGKQIAFVGHHEGNSEVYVMDMATRAMTNLSRSKYDDYNPIWSPDGHYLAYFHRQIPYSRDAFQLRVVEVATKRIYPATPDYGSIIPGYVRWTPDSKKLLFLAYPGWGNYDLATKVLHIDPGLGHIGPGEIGIRSSDGQGALAINSDTPDGLPMKLVLADALGQYHTVLQLNISFALDSWSPTRDQIAFYSYTGVYVLDVPTGNYRDFIQGAGKIMTVDWSPDGNYLASLIATASARKVAVADIRSGAVCSFGSDNLPHRSIDQPVRYRYIYSDPQWSPTDDQVVFSSGSDGASNLILLTMPS